MPVRMVRQIAAADVYSFRTMPTQPKLSSAVIAVVSEALADRYTHTELNSLFETAGAPGEPPPGNKIEKCKAWFRAANKAAIPDSFLDETSDEIDVIRLLGAVLEEYMDVPISDDAFNRESREKHRERINNQVAAGGLRYARGGKVYGASLSAPTKSLDEKLRSRALSTVEDEIARALTSVDNDPPAALTAACALLEAVCKAYIAEEVPDEMPAKSDLQAVWKVVAKRLKFDPTLVESQDLKQILGGLFSIVHGVSALRTHDGSAHGQKPARRYKIEPRHARLSVHAAHTLALFVIETWERSK